MKNYVVNYLTYVNVLRAEYNSYSKALKTDDREDEAVLYRVRTNICDIFYNMVNATEKKVAAMKIVDEEEENRRFNEEYLSLFEKIPESWKVNLEQAKRYHDVITVKTEEVKLDTTDILRNKFLETAGCATIASGREPADPMMQEVNSAVLKGGLRS